jgi:hypothetical protein
VAVALVVLGVVFLVEVAGHGSGGTGTGDIRPGEVTAPP